MNIFGLLAVVATFLILSFVRRMGRETTSLRRGAVIWASIFIGAFAGLFGGMGFFTLVNPHPQVATQDVMGEGIFCVFLLAPAGAAAGGFLAAKLTKTPGEPPSDRWDDGPTDFRDGTD